MTIRLAGEIPDRLAACAITAGGIAQTRFACPSVEDTESVLCPFLIMHGEKDTTVRPHASALLKKVLDRNGVPNERHVFEGIGHPLHREKREEVYQMMKAWFEKHGVLQKD